MAVRNREIRNPTLSFRVSAQLHLSPWPSEHSFACVLSSCCHRRIRQLFLCALTLTEVAHVRRCWTDEALTQWQLIRQPVVCACFTVNCSEVVAVSWVIMAAPKECIELHNVRMAWSFQRVE